LTTRRLNDWLLDAGMGMSWSTCMMPSIIGLSVPYLLQVSPVGTYMNIGCNRYLACCQLRYLSYLNPYNSIFTQATFRFPNAYYLSIASATLIASISLSPLRLCLANCGAISGSFDLFLRSFLPSFIGLTKGSSVLNSKHYLSRNLTKPTLGIHTLWA